MAYKYMERDHNAVFVRFSIHFTKPLSHNLEDLIAAHDKNQVIAIPITEHTSFQMLTHNQATSKDISHHKISCFHVSTLVRFIALIILTRTVDILTAKQIIAGENIIGIRFFTVIYFRTSIVPSTPFSRSKAFNKTIIGDNTIAIHKTPILKRNTIIITIKGIDMASICKNERIIFNSDTYTQLSVVGENLKFVQAFNNDPYNAVNTQA